MGGGGVEVGLQVQSQRILFFPSRGCKQQRKGDFQTGLQIFFFMPRVYRVSNIN